MFGSLVGFGAKKDDLSEGLFAHYPLDTNSLDIHGGFDGVDVNMSYTGDSAVFDGTGYFDVPITLSASQAFTYSGWVYSTETTATYRNVVDVFNTGLMVWADINGKIEFDAGKYRTSLVYREQWVHIVLSKPSANTSAKYYVNGVLLGTGSAYQIQFGDLDLFNRSGGGRWKGNGSNVRLYNDAKDQEFVTKLYNEGR